MNSTTLFDSEFLKKLEYLQLISKRLPRSSDRGEHMTSFHGVSLEFSDHRNYQVGDDFRYIDWNAYGRLDKLFLKIFSAEEDLHVHILLDHSQSMMVGDPSKLDYARRVAAALGYIALANLDRVGISVFDSRLETPILPQKGKKHVFSLFNYLDKVTCKGFTNFSVVLKEFATRSKRTGLAIIISDLLDENGFEMGLEALLYKKFDVVLIQILAEEEIDPQLSGSYKLVDLETGESRRVMVDQDLMEAYHKKFGEFLLRIEDFCLKRGIEYIRASTIVPFEDLILKYLRQGAHLR
ncbi:MAG: DUF58 domain-containing protein [bacterium]